MVHLSGVYRNWKSWKSAAARGGPSGARAYPEIFEKCFH